MTNYVQIERDFIERTLEIIDQYKAFVVPEVKNSKQYEVTLLMNCLLGILVYPQQIALQKNADDWLKDFLVSELDSSWGIQLSHVKNAGCYSGRRGEIERKDLNLRDLTRQMRNAATHAHFDSNRATTNIEELIFTSTSDDRGFRLEITVPILETFVRKLAQLALKEIIARPKTKSTTINDND